MRDSESYAKTENVWLASDFLSDEPVENNSDEKLVQLCGSCGHRGNGFHAGFTGESATFREYYCPECWSACFRHSIVIVTESRSDWGEAEVKTYCKSRADVDFWHGEVIADTSVENPIGLLNETDCGLADFRRGSMSTAVNWTPRCPICAAEALPDKVFDFHHWDYETDCGVQICRDCHEYIHRGKTVTEQEELPDVDNWETDSIARMIKKASAHGILTHRPEVRFNIPYQLLEQIDYSITELITEVD
jgi:hypothetical protein